jgi:hypothetical protein
MLPDYWIERPPMRLGRSTHSAIEEFLSLGRVADSLVDVDTFLRERGDVTSWQILVRPLGAPEDRH